MHNQSEILVVGGGPAGSTIATLLAQRGRQVVLLEKDHHPRFHIGESLLPANVRLLESLGVADQVARIGMPKLGIEFVSPSHAHQAFVEFRDCWDKSMPYAWQVRRADFDEILLRNAQAKGAQVHEGVRVRDLQFHGRGKGARVTAVDESGRQHTWDTRFVVDASGRDTLLANRLRMKLKNPRHNSSALFAHVRGATRLPGEREGNISIFWFEHGWFWFIPLTDGVTSIGAVCWPHYLKSRSTDLETFFHDTVALAPKLKERLADAELVSPVHATGNYSYTARHTHGEDADWLLLGDAFAFVDPVFSSGVYLAMTSAIAGAEAVTRCLDQPAGATAALARFDRHVRKGPRDFSWYIYRVTNPMMRELFMYPRNPLRMKEALLALLAGDIYGGSPIRPSLAAFKAVYYAGSLANLGRTWQAWKRRRINIRDTEAA